MLSFAEVYPISNKAFHFNKLREKSGIPFSEMLFFDGASSFVIYRQAIRRIFPCHGSRCASPTEHRLCEDCNWGDKVGEVERQCGVVGIACPSGLTIEAWHSGLAAFARQAAEARRATDSPTTL